MLACERLHLTQQRLGYVVDTNVLVYAHRPEMAMHAPAVRTMRELASSPRAWSIPWPCLHEFFAVVTRSPFSPTSPPGDALDQIAAWLESPSLVLLAETNTHFEVLTELVQVGTVAGTKVHDARIAAICLSHGVSELITMDHDFARFPQLKTRSLLSS